MDYRFAAARFNSDGSLDTSFDGDGKLTTDFGATLEEGQAIAVDSSERIIIAGEVNGQCAIVRYDRYGSLDATFGSGGKVTTDINSGTTRVSEVLVGENGKIVVVGTAYLANGPAQFLAARYNVDGTLDTSFDFDGKLVVDAAANGSNVAHAATVDHDGRLILVLKQAYLNWL